MRLIRYVLPLLLAGAFHHAQAASAPDGIWTRTGDHDYDAYLKLSGDDGFLCVLDGKSSYLFTVAGDSMTTPMNGKNGLAYDAASGHLTQSGKEKGVAYAEEYAPIGAGAYPKACADEEAALRGGDPTALAKPQAPGRAVSPVIRGVRRDFLGRAIPSPVTRK